MKQCMTCAKSEGEGPLERDRWYCSEVCELSGWMPRGQAIAVEAMRRNTEALNRLVEQLKGKP